MNTKETESWTCERSLNKQIHRRLSERHSHRETGLCRKQVLNLDESTSGVESQKRESSIISASLADLKKEKNRESAKAARLKRKLHVSMLERKIRTLTVELNFVREQSKMGGMMKSQDDLSANLPVCGINNLREDDQKEASSVSLERLAILRSNTIPKLERKKLLELHLEQFMELTQTPFSKYFFHSVASKTGFFKDQTSQLTGPAKYLSEELQLDQTQISELKDLTPEFEKLNGKFSTYISEMQKIKSQIFSFTDSCDLLLNKFAARFNHLNIPDFCTKPEEDKSLSTTDHLFDGDSSSIEQNESEISKEQSTSSFLEEAILGKRTFLV